MDNIISDFIEAFEKRLSELIPHNASSARYSLFSSGKRLRPQLLFAASYCFSKEFDDILDLCASLEMIHTYSLIHDDLPCMDDDTLRRGKPTLHCVVSEGEALLTGDYLLTYAFEILSQTEKVNEKARLRMVQVVARKSGLEGMIGGQAIDLASEGKMIDLKTLETMYEKKTGALFSAALMCGAIARDARKEDLKSFDRLGKLLGIAYQIVDDLEDALNPDSSDLMKNKPTIVSFLGIEKAKEYKEELFKQALLLVEKIPGRKTLLEEIVSKLCS